MRPKTAEPGSPLLRRALSPDRLHPRSAESKCSLISPLCSSGTPPAVKAQVRGSTSAVWRSSSQQDKEKENEGEVNQPSGVDNGNSENRLSLNLSGPGELLPRIAEEKDSPTNGTQEVKLSDKAKCDKNPEEDEGKQSEASVLPGNTKKSDKISKQVESSKQSDVIKAVSEDSKKGNKQSDNKKEKSASSSKASSK